MAAPAPCSPYRVAGSQEGSLLPERCILFFPVFGDSWSSQTYLRLLWCLAIERTLVKTPLVPLGCLPCADVPVGPRLPLTAARQTELDRHCFQRAVPVLCGAGRSPAGLTDV